MQQLLSVVDKKKMELCLYVCEDSSHFSTDEFFSTIRTFRGMFLGAIKVRGQSERSSVISEEVRFVLDRRVMMEMTFKHLTAGWSSLRKTSVAGSWRRRNGNERKSPPAPVSDLRQATPPLQQRWVM